MVPIGAQAHQLAIEGDANAAAHAHDHRLALEGFELCPLRLELLLTPDLLTLGGLLELWVDSRFPALVEGEFGQSAFIVDGYRGLVLDGALDVIDADIVAEYGPGVGVPELDRCSREADKGSLGQGIAHVAGIAVDEVVLAAVCLVSDDHDIAPL